MTCFCLSCCILEKISMGNHLKHLDVITAVSKGQCFGREDPTIIHQELNSRFFSSSSRDKIDIICVLWIRPLRLCYPVRKKRA
ncbi:hypothetical protein PALA111701_28430 [Paenibacillus lactis]